MKNMSKDEQNTGSVEEKNTQAGSSTDNNTGPEGSAAGEPDAKGTQTNEEKGGGENTVPKEQYEELEKKLGLQGKEIGEYREFYKTVGPLLEELDKQPELVEAIVGGKIDQDLVKAALEGKVSIQEAKDVSEAHAKVKEKLGEEKYDAKSPEEIQKLIADEVAKATKGIKDDFSKSLSESEQIRQYESEVSAFISNTDDFGEYAADIKKWFDDHPEQDDIEVAYNAVKGAALAVKAKKSDDDEEAKAKKDAAANAAGGGSQNSTVINDNDVVDELIAPKANPNIF